MVVKRTGRGIGILKISRSETCLNFAHRRTYPVSRIQVEIFHLAVLEEARQSNTIISQMRFLSDDHNVVFSSFGIHFQELFSASCLVQILGQTDYTRRARIQVDAYMNAIPTIPSPTTTTLCRCEGGLGYCAPSSSGS